MLRHYLLPVAVYVFYRMLMASWRITLDECPNFQQALRDRTPVVLAHWHGDELALLHLVVRYRIATITSTSRDGELMNRVLGWLGAVTARGSSTRGGAGALRGVIGHCRRNGHNVSFAVDGPKGPIYRVKPGVFEVSRLMDAPIYAVSVGVSSPWVFHRSWNKSVLPRFFSRVHVRVVPAMAEIGRGEDPRDPALAQRLENILHEGKQAMCLKLACARP